MPKQDKKGECKCQIVRLNRELEAKELSLKDVSAEDAPKVYGVRNEAINGFGFCGVKNASTCENTGCKNHADYNPPPPPPPGKPKGG